MFALLPLLTMTMLVLIFQQFNQSWRRSIVLAAVVWGTLLTAITESLSWFNALSIGWLIGVWSLVTTVLTVFFYRLSKANGTPFKVRTIKSELLKSEIIDNTVSFRRFRRSPVLLIFLGGVALIIATIGLIAIIAPPNTWDSMTYHMSRVAHWMQNGSVAHYPTYNLPQLFQPPLAEFAILNLQILSGGDRFANLIQWFSMVGSVIGVSLIAKQLGASIQGQAIAAIFAVTIPMGILQASSTQNDYVVCFWIVCLAYFVLEVVQEQLDLPQAAAIGASLGLAVLTKGTAYFLTFPFLVWLVAAHVGNARWSIWKPLFAMGAIVTAINLNHYLRNLELFGSLLGAPDAYAKEYRIEVISLPIFLTNIVRNLSLHNDIVRTLNLQKFITPMTGLVDKGVRLLHSLLNVDINDPRTTHPPGSYQVPGISFDENVAGNPLHLMLIFGAIALFLCYRRLRSQSSYLFYATAAITGFLLICLLLKLQPYQSRHHLTSFVLLAPVIGVVFSQALNRYLTTVLIVVLIITSIPWVLENKFRPIAAESNIFTLSRVEQYFINRPKLQAPYEESVHFVQSRHCEQVGLWMGTSDTIGNRYWEYPFWILFAQNHAQRPRIEHVNVQNVSIKKEKMYVDTQFEPCAVIAVRSEKDAALQDNKTVILEQPYINSFTKELVTVFTKNN